MYLAHKSSTFLGELSGTGIGSLMLGVFGWSRMSERRPIGLLAMDLWLVAGFLMLSATVAHGSNLIGIVAGIGFCMGAP